MTVPYTFANQRGNIPLSELDANFTSVSEHVDTAGTVTTNAQPNITSVGTLTSLSVTGNIQGSYILGNGSQLTGITAGGGSSDANALTGSTLSSNVTLSTEFISFLKASDLL